MSCTVDLPTDKKFADLLEQNNGNEIKAILAYYRKGTDPVTPDLAILLNSRRAVASPITASILARSETITELADKSGYLTPQGIFKRVGSLISSFSQRISKEPLKDENGKELSFEEATATKDAMKRWKQAGVAVSEPLKIEGKEYSFNAWIAQKMLILKYGARKGTAIHAYIQSRIESDPVKAKAALTLAQEIEEELGDGIYRKDFSWAGENYKQILANLGVNIDDETPPWARDILRSEVRVMSELLGIAGTIDLMVEHQDGFYTFIDFKTGAKFNSRLFTDLMRYGQQEKSIYDTDLDRAKLQVMLYAILAKAEHPTMKFRGLKVGHIPNEVMALSGLLDNQVDVSSYLRMIQQFLQDPKEVAQAGLPADVYEKLLAASPELFNPTEYLAPDLDLVTEAMLANKSNQTLLEEKKAELSLIINSNPNDVWYGKAQRDKAATLAYEIIELQKGNVSTAISSDMEISPFTRYFGLYEDTNNPILQVFKQVQDEAKYRKERIYEQKKSKFNELLQPILDAYLRSSGSVLFKLTRDQLGTIKYSDMYGFMWRTRTVDEMTFDDFVTVEEAIRDGYSEDQIKFIRFVSEEFAEFFEGDKALWNRPAAIVKRGDKDKVITVGDVYNKNNPPFKYPGRQFAPRVPITTSELRQQSGFFSNRFFNHLKRKHLSDYVEHTFEGSNQVGMPIKYIGNPDVNTSGNYTRNVELIFDRFMNGMLAKEHFDEVYSLGQGLKQYFYMKDEKGGLFKRTMEFIDDRMMNDLVGRYRQDPQSRKGFIINKQGDRLDIFKLVQTLKSIVAAPIMWVKPVNGGINGLFAGMINTRKAVVGSLGEQLLGISSNVTDFGVTDLAFAHKEFMQLQLDYIRGTQKDNKLYHLIRHTKYLPDNFDFGTTEKDLISISNKSVREGAMYWFHTMPEEWNAITVLVAQMNNMKLKDGRTLYDAYKVEKSTSGEYQELVWDGGLRGYVKTGTGELEELRGLTSLEINKMRRVYQKLQGQYRRDERHNAELYVWGQMILQFKKYLPTILKNLFASKGTDLSLGYYQKTKERKDGEDVYEWTGRLTEGRLRVLGAVLVNLATGNNEQYDWSKLSDDQKQGLVDSMFTIATTMTMYLGYLAAYGDTDDDDSMKKLTKRIIDNYSQQYNPEDILRTLNQPPVIFASLLNTSKSFSQMFVASAYMVSGNKEEAYTQEGDFKGKNEMLKRFPIVTSFNELKKFIENNKSLDESIANENR